MSSTIITPAYNEEKRIAPFLKDLSLFTSQYPEDFEIIVVDDGSQDHTIEIIQPFRDLFTDYKIISYHPNQGKGAAIQRGVFRSTSDQIIFMDADGATSPQEIPKMLNWPGLAQILLATSSCNIKVISLGLKGVVKNFSKKREVRL